MNTTANVFSSTQTPHSAAFNIGAQSPQGAGPQPKQRTAAEIEASLRKTYPTFAKIYDVSATSGKLCLELLARIIAAIIAAIMSIFRRKQDAPQKDEEKPAPKMKFGQDPASHAEQTTHEAPHFAAEGDIHATGPQASASVDLGAGANTQSAQATAPSNPHNMDVEDIVFREVGRNLQGLSAPDLQAATSMLAKVIPSVTNEKFIAQLSQKHSDNVTPRSEHADTADGSAGPLALHHDASLDTQASGEMAKVAYEVAKLAKSALNHSFEEKISHLQKGVTELLSGKMVVSMASATARLCVSSLPEIESHGILNRETLALVQDYMVNNQSTVEEMLALKLALQRAVSADTSGVTDHQAETQAETDTQQADVVELEMARPKTLG